MSFPRLSRSSSALSLLLLAPSAAAQYGVEWVEFQKDDSHLSAGTISDSNNETDLAWDDLDQDGWIDLAVVRKQPFTSTGKRTNLLLMNESGVLTDRTTQYASDADVGGDQGFKTTTNDRDVVLPDVNGDGWLDLVTATTLSDGDPKHIGHPRVYRNKGGSGATWNGLRFENGRIPQLLHFGTGNPQNPRFCSVAAGDVTGNGFPDLYFGDYDSSGAGGAQQGSNEDLNDRLLINDGSGFFSDQSQARMTSDMLKSAFGMAVDIEDMNLNGLMDVVKDTALNAPQDVRVVYNNASNEGFFNQNHKFHTGFAPYHEDVGDLNNDGRPDILITDDGSDRYRYNTGTDALQRAIWGSAKTFQFLSGSDEGFGSNNLIADLDGDGWNDALICDVDVDIGGYNRRLHIYHNPGGSVGAQITLKEERQQSGTSEGPGWVGAVGLYNADMEGTHDVAPLDVDNDGDVDLVISRRNGTSVWENTKYDGVYGISFGSSSNGPAGAPTLFGLTPPAAGSNLTVRLGNLSAGKPGFIGYSASKYASAIDLSSGLLLNISLPLLLMRPVTTDGSGAATDTVSLPPAAAGLTIYAQGAALDGAGANLWAASLGLQLDVE